MNRKLLLLSALLTSFVILSCSTSSSTQSVDKTPAEDDMIVKIGSQPFTLNDLTNYYEKNNTNNEYDEDDLKEFLPFYADFQLKLAYGKEMGLHEDPVILSEFRNYSKQAAFSYWLENDIKQQLLDEFTERSKYEVKAHHVLIRLQENSATGRVEEAVKTLNRARRAFLSGETTVEELNRNYSTNIQGRPAGGELPWMSAGVTVKPFEDALFEIQPGDISEPVRTQFGYHLIYLEDKRERTPDRYTRHIFIRTDREDLSAQQLSEEAYQALEAGRPWVEVVKEFSQDGSSVNSGGDIGWIGYGRQFSADFISTVMAADTSRAYTKPVQTNYGYHVFKIDSVRSYQNEDQRRAELLKELEELPRYKADRKLVLERIEEIGNLHVNDETFHNIKEFFSSADTASVSNVSPGPELADDTLITFNETVYSVDDFKEWVNNTHEQRNASDFSDLWVQTYKEHILNQSVVEMTKNRFPDFERNVEGFLNGLIVFEVSDKNIWSPERADTTALKQYYEENIDRYQYDQRFDYTLLASRNDSVLSVATDRVEAGEEPAEFAEEIEGLIVSRDSVSAPAEEIQNTLDTLNSGELSEPFTYRNRTTRLLLNQILDSRTMTFSEALNRVNSDYQPIREEAFLERLREKYNVETYPERIRLK